MSKALLQIIKRQVDELERVGRIVKALLEEIEIMGRNILCIMGSDGFAKMMMEPDKEEGER